MAILVCCIFGYGKKCSSALDLRSLVFLGSVHISCHWFLTPIPSALNLSLLQMYLILLKFFFLINFLRTKPKYILSLLTSFMETPFSHTTFAFPLFQELLNMVITIVKFLRLMNILEFCLFWIKSIVKKVIIIFVTRNSILIS